MAYKSIIPIILIGFFSMGLVYSQDYSTYLSNKSKIDDIIKGYGLFDSNWVLTQCQAIYSPKKVSKDINMLLKVNCFIDNKYYGKSMPDIRKYFDKRLEFNNDSTWASIFFYGGYLQAQVSYYPDSILFVDISPLIYDLEMRPDGYWNYIYIDKFVLPFIKHDIFIESGKERFFSYKYDL